MFCLNDFCILRPSTTNSTCILGVIFIRYLSLALFYILQRVICLYYIRCKETSFQI